MSKPGACLVCRGLCSHPVTTLPPPAGVDLYRAGLAPARPWRRATTPGGDRG